MMVPMFGVGLVFVLFFLLLVIGVPLLILALVARGDSATSPRVRPPAASPGAAASNVSGYVGKCPTCGRGVKADWNVCPSCGAALS